MNISTKKVVFKYDNSLKISIFSSEQFNLNYKIRHNNNRYCIKLKKISDFRLNYKFFLMQKVYNFFILHIYEKKFRNCQNMLLPLLLNSIKKQEKLKRK